MLPPGALDVLARRFALLADCSRLRVLHQLMAEGEASVGELVAATGLSQPNVSHHLSRLAAAEVVVGRRQGTRVVYRVIDPSVKRLCDLVCDAERFRRERALAAIGEGGPDESE